MLSCTPNDGVGVGRKNLVLKLLLLHEKVVGVLDIL